MVKLLILLLKVDEKVHKIKSSLDAADMFLTRHMMQGLELPQNPLINILTRPRIPRHVAVASHRVSSPGLRIINYCSESRVSSQNRNDLMSNDG